MGDLKIIKNKSMKITDLFFCLTLCLTYGCEAQKKGVEITQCTKGNTGFRGRVPKEEIGGANLGNDYYTISIKAKKKCAVEIIKLTVLGDGGQLILKPVFENNTAKMALKAGETVVMRVVRDSEQIVAKPNIKGEGSLTLKVDNKLLTLPIEKFEAFLPQ